MLGIFLKIFLFLTLFIVNFSLLAQTHINLGQSFTFSSKIMEEERQFHVYLPPSYSDASAPSFPVIYILDGDVHRLKAVVGIVEGLSTETLERQIKETIIIAIPSSKNAIRERDLTPTDVDWIFKDQTLEEFEGIGNASNYLRFFEKELIPLIENKFRTTQQKVLVGESFGGLFASYVLITNPTVFTDYLIIDATYLWDDNYLNRQLIKLGANHIIGNAYFTFANNADFGEIGSTNKQWGYEFFDNLDKLSTGNFKATKRYFENESHGTVALQSWYFGFRHLLLSESEK